MNNFKLIEKDLQWLKEAGNIDLAREKLKQLPYLEYKRKCAEGIEKLRKEMKDRNNFKSIDNRALVRHYTTLMTTFERLPEANPNMMDEAQECFNEIVRRMENEH